MEEISRMSRRHKEKNITINASRQPVNDAFSNGAARLGVGTYDLTQGTEYIPTRRTQDYNLLTTLYREEHYCNDSRRYHPQVVHA